MLYETELSRHLFSDPNNNNNKKLDKYSLRPRSTKKRILSEDIYSNEDLPSTVTTNGNNVILTTKQKPKSAPLSKYRRKTANARERTRMKEINQAFEALRKAVPQMSQHPGTNNEKLTKITTLRHAMKYITTLNSLLNGEINHQDFLSDCSSSDLDCLFLESDAESLPIASDFSDTTTLSCDISSNTDFSQESFNRMDDFSSLDYLPHFETFLEDFS